MTTRVDHLINLESNHLRIQKIHVEFRLLHMRALTQEYLVTLFAVLASANLLEDRGSWTIGGQGPIHRQIMLMNNQDTSDLHVQFHWKARPFFWRWRKKCMESLVIEAVPSSASTDAYPSFSEPISKLADETVSVVIPRERFVDEQIYTLRMVSLKCGVVYSRAGVKYVEPQQIQWLQNGDESDLEDEFDE